MEEKNRLILRHPKIQTPAEKASLVKRINEGYVLFHLFLFLIFLKKKKFPKHILSDFLERLYRATHPRRPRGS